MRYKLICCEVFVRELCHLIARCPNEIDVEFLPKGLHDIGQEGMSSRIHQVVDRVDESLFDAIIFGYGLCNNGLVGLKAKTIPIVLPRAHDCITIFLGSKERYIEYFQKNPGTYFLTSGWIERGNATGELAQLSIQQQSGMNDTYEELVEKYGEDNADFLWEELGNNSKNYGKLAFIEMGIEASSRFEAEAKRRAKEKDWKFEKLAGDLSLLDKLLLGDWDKEQFLVVPPGHETIAAYNEKIVSFKKSL
jgi:Protein of unknown function (DUF1638)